MVIEAPRLNSFLTCNAVIPVQPALQDRAMQKHDKCSCCMKCKLRIWDSGCNNCSGGPTLARGFSGKPNLPLSESEALEFSQAQVTLVS
ncbi:hypothetical protein DUNSADRAFT_2101 [Dunaliella salina]|uniref:Encoded protein n=1 Tax=Dunaliella salina TaxID=3046 RepID=A0ABQ7GW52_DUNSA|nr:hypothetical protein DUNSADRAFT_2101 [Dunaliella salina]|eukprot:KAF5838843.1 hypothetical protein DUNSADRAFT_2101 [Dunaliella salina]